MMLTVEQQQLLDSLTEIIRAAVQSGMEVERERCAYIAENNRAATGKDIAAAIRDIAR